MSARLIDADTKAPHTHYCAPVGWHGRKAFFVEKLSAEAARLYPATYRAPFWGRMWPSLIYMPWYILLIFAKAISGPAMPGWFWLMIVMAFLLILLGLLNDSFCNVTLYADRIEKKTWLSSKIMKRYDVGQMRKLRLGLVILTYKYNKSDGIVLPRGIGGDAAWETWMMDSGKL